MWELSGIPCVHAVAGYIHMKMEPELGVSEWFSQNKWFEAYQYFMRPVPGSRHWKPSDLEKHLPPVERKLPGRPRKKRIKHPSENDHEVSRNGRIMHCHRCWEAGHNRKNCTKTPRPKPENFYDDMSQEENPQDDAQGPSNTNQFQQPGPNEEQQPIYFKDPVLPPPSSNSGTKRKDQPSQKKATSKKTKLGQACSSSGIKITPNASFS